MVDDRLEQACALAEKVRFSGDTLRGEGEGAANQTDHLRSYFAQGDLLICDAVTPALSVGLRRVYERLHVPAEAVQAFVYASPMIQAECFASNPKICMVRFSSAIVDLLDEDEIEFVAGHESSDTSCSDMARWIIGIASKALNFTCNCGARKSLPTESVS